MKTLSHGKKALIFFIVLTFMGAFAAPGMAAAAKIYKMKGKIIAVDLDYNTVVVDVPIGKKIFRVAGPLSPDAVLKKGGGKASLSDFHEGEWVTVEWEHTDKGHIVKMLVAK